MSYNDKHWDWCNAMPGAEVPGECNCPATPNSASREKCIRCGWVMGARPLDCQNDGTPHKFPSSLTSSFIAMLHAQAEWSIETFGPGYRVEQVMAHIDKEQVEAAADPTNVTEWVDIAMLAYDGAQRHGATGEDFVFAWIAKFGKNLLREWPDWREVPTGQPIEHLRGDS